MYFSNSGYVGMSMSVRAAEAYENGAMPLSKWTKREILAYIEDETKKSNHFKGWNTEELKTLLVYDSWHHTSAAFNETSFHEIDFDKVYEYLGGKEKPVIKIEKKVLKEEEGYFHGTYTETEYHPFATNKFKKYITHYINFENARKKGGWYIMPDGKRKKESNCFIKAHTKNKRRNKAKKEQKGK